MRLLIVTGVLALVACVPVASPETVPTKAVALSIAGTASLFAVDKNNPAGPLSLYGTARIHQWEGAVKLQIDTVLPGKDEYGMHIHTVGKCDAPDFTTAGPHWNPDAKQHGRDNPAGAHHGDLPNIGPTDLSGSFPYVSKEIKLDIPDLNALFDADGAALIIHEKADDYRSDPTGNSGKRLICGVFEKR